MPVLGDIRDYLAHPSAEEIERIVDRYFDSTNLGELLR
jgi:hypothetical protein